MGEFWAAAKSFGFGIAALVIVVVAVWASFWKKIWPYMEKQLAEAQQRLDSSTEASQKRLDDTTKAFLDALSEQREMQRQGFDKMAALIGVRHDRTDDKIDKAKGSRR